jgi:hypothetical protein
LLNPEKGNSCYSLKFLLEVKIKMKWKIALVFTLICAMTISILGGALVYAPAPGNPLLPLDVIVKNTDPIQVSIDGTVEIDSSENVNVEIPDGVEVTNTVTVDGKVGIDDSDPVNVEVANSNPLTVDVSGWLHTTKQGSQVWNQGYGPGPFYSQMVIDTNGYREITIVFYANENNAEFEIDWMLDGDFSTREEWVYSTEKTASGSSEDYFFKTYPIQGENLRIFFYVASASATTTIELHYYMTT